MHLSVNHRAVFYFSFATLRCGAHGFFMPKWSAFTHARLHRSETISALRAAESQLAGVMNLVSCQ